MARNKSPLQIKLEYYPIRWAFSLLYKLPLPWAEAFCQFVLRGLFLMMPQRMHIQEANLASCFPDRTPEERRAIADTSMRTVARGVASMPRIPDVARGTSGDWIIQEGFHFAEEAFTRGKGLLTFSAHYGFWEAMPLYLQYTFGRISMVARPLDNPLLDNLVNSCRTSN